MLSNAVVPDRGESRSHRPGVFGLIARVIPLYEPVLLVAAVGMILGGMQAWAGYVAPDKLSDEFLFRDNEILTLDGVLVARFRDGQWHYTKR